MIYILAEYNRERKTFTEEEFRQFWGELCNSLKLLTNEEVDKSLLVGKKVKYKAYLASEEFTKNKSLYANWREIVKELEKSITTSAELVEGSLTSLEEIINTKNDVIFN